VAHFSGKLYSPRFNMVDLLSRFRDNLVRRVSLLCLSCRERPWLRLVMGPSRNWVVNKIWTVAKTLPVLSEFEILLMTNAALFLPYRSQRNSAAEWSSNLTTCLAHVKCHVPNRSKTSESVSWNFDFGGNLFSSLWGIWMLNSTSVTYAAD